jgi:hypothetical protein
MKTDLRHATTMEIRNVSCGRESSTLLCRASDINVDGNLLGEVWLIHG